MLLTVVLLWSGNFTAMRFAVQSFHPLAFSSLRFALGAAAYALFVWWREGSLHIARRDLGAVVLLAAIGIFLNQVAVIYAVPGLEESGGRLIECLDVPVDTGEH